MESLNNNYLCQQLIIINKKYEYNSFVDIDFIQLFGLNDINAQNDINVIKKKLTTKYYNLSLKYHPDKHLNNENTIVPVINVPININEIKDGSFVSFINDIYNMLQYIIKNEPETIINIINGNASELLNFDLISDHYSLKKNYTLPHTQEYTKPSENQVENFRSKLKSNQIIETKLLDTELNNLIETKNDERSKLTIEKQFTDEQTSDKHFNKVFNNTFDDQKNSTIFNDEQDNDQTLEMCLRGYGKSCEVKEFNDSMDLSLVAGELSKTISNIDEAFSPIMVNNKLKVSKKTPEEMYAEMLEQRCVQDDIFKDANKLKKI